MGVKSAGAALLAVKAILSSPTKYSASANRSDAIDSGGLRRKRSNVNYRSDKQGQLGLSESSSRRRLSIDEDLQRFFLPTKEGDGIIDEIDMRELLIQMNLYLPSMSVMTQEPTRSSTPAPTKPPSPMPTESLAPTLTSCENPGTCENRLRDQIYGVSVRVGTVDALDDPNSPQSRASAWIVEECGADPPIDPCDVSLLNLNEQRYALAVMYFSLNGDDWNAGANPGQDPSAPAGQWMSGLNYCDWGADVAGEDGTSYNQLVCDEFGNVLNLNLQSNNMVGPIAPEIGVLKYLTSYISFFNAQSGPIPTSLGLITPLQTFDVESNNMDGDLFKPEYSGPSGLKEIVNFRASLNNFVGTIPTEIGQWTKLQNLWFADNELTGTLPTELGNCADMGAFLLYSNKIGGTLPTELGNMNSLTWIDMEDNDVVGTIPEDFYSNLDLEQVILKSNALTGTLSDRVGDLTSLTTFWVSFNELTGSIPTSIGNCVNLEELELQNNALTGSIPTEFGNIQTIEFISVEQNELSGTIPAQLFDPALGALRILYVNNNKLTGQIPENYGQAPRLKDLWMNDNLLSGTLPIIAEGEFLFLGENICADIFNASLSRDHSATCPSFLRNVQRNY
ncbi:hypothetical protein HJC23_006514 [Cyclotella cryptica]|uniref:L domain-like protein n=1 Tax=Cyclotella cryptica TaxID=29204 RepID=A0ABD3PT33_9STRA|eukprot:CCRYP_013000-RA/>CCRYP_013000-RA protein AED:0.03 eAED:0.03 QI:156/1/1/1/1/1/3/319/619